MIKEALNFLMKAPAWRVGVLACFIAVYFLTKVIGDKNGRLDVLTAENKQCLLEKEWIKRRSDSIINAIYMAERNATIAQQLEDIRSMKEQINAIKNK